MSVNCTSTQMIFPISVVVVSLGDRNDMLRCLNALAQQRNVPRLERLVVCDGRVERVAELQTHFPAVQFLVSPGRRTFAELRAMGVKHACGEIVALTEDHCIPDPDWCAEILHAHRSPHAAIGGVVQKEGADTSVNWAIYLADYLRYRRPVQDGESEGLSDCNVSYKRDALNQIASVWQNEFHEPDVHRALKPHYGELWISSRICVNQQRSLSLTEATRERYAFGRLLGSGQTGAAWRLWLRAMVMPALPLLLVGRVARHALRKRTCLAELVRTLPLLLLFSGCWSVGEFVGTVTGRPPQSLMPAQNNLSPQKVTR